MADKNKKMMAKAIKLGGIFLLIYVVITVLAVCAAPWEHGATIVLWEGLQYPAIVFSNFLDEYVLNERWHVDNGHGRLIGLIFRCGAIWFLYGMAISCLITLGKKLFARRQA